jgi:GT2 family glycosyltransferase
MPLLSIIIVNYRSAALIMDCLRTVLQFNDSTQFEFIVVDNNSDNAEGAQIRAAFPMVKWIQMGYNAGFARANNAGIRAAASDMFLLLNPDTLAVDNSISRCLHQLQHSGWIGAGVQLLNPDGSPQTSGSFFVKGGLNHVLPIPYWGGFIRWLGYRSGSRAPGLTAVSDNQEVDWLNGAFIMVKKQAVDAAGMLDEDFFLYSEEIEWCSRLRKVGRLGVFGQLHMVHLQGETLGNNGDVKGKGYEDLFDRKGLQLMVSHHVRIRKQYGVFWFLVLLVNYTWGILVFAIASFFDSLFHGGSPVKQWRQVGQFAANVWSLWRLSPAIIRGSPNFYKIL